MAKKISPQDLFTQIDIFKGIRESADKTITKMSELQSNMKKTAESLKTAMKGAKFDSSESLKTFNQNTREALKLSQEFEKTQKMSAVAEQQRQKAMQQAEITEQKRNKTAESALNLKKKQRAENERLMKQQQKQKKLAKDEADAYKRLVRSTRDLKNESKRLGAELLILEQKGKKNTQAYVKLEKQYNKVTNAAQRGDKQLKKLDKRVGDNFRNVGNYAGALGKLTSVLGTLGVAFGAASAIRNITGIIIDFDQAVADLAAISGQSKEQIKGLNDQAKQLGATTQFSATQITQMQIELAKLGFTNEQIEGSTKAVSNFAAATGADIPAAAQVAGAALRGFGLDVSEMDRVVSVLGVATTKSALSFEHYQTSLSKVAPVAASFGFSIEDTTALLGQLANAGFDASTAATATKNILLNLADSSGDLAKELGRPIESADDLALGLQELQSRGIDLATALDLTDKRSVAAFNTFLKGSDDLIEFRDSITDVNDELDAMAKKRLDSVQGKLTLLSSAWEGYILKLNDAANASAMMKGILGFLAKNLGTIMTVILKLIRAFVVYKTTMIAARTAQKLYNTDFSKMGKLMLQQIPFTKQYAKAQQDVTTNTKAASAATKGFGRAIASIGLFAIIGLVTELAMAWYDVASGAKQARLEQELADKAKQNAADISSKIIQDKNKEFNKREKEIEKDIRERRIAGEDEDALEKERLRRLKENVDKTKKELSDEISRRTDEFIKISKASQIMANFVRGGKMKNPTTGYMSSFFDDMGNVYTKGEAQTLINPYVQAMGVGAGISVGTADALKAGVDKYAAQQIAILDKLEEEEESYNDMLEDRILSFEELAANQSKYKKTTGESTKEQKTFNTTFKEQNEYLSKERELRQAILEIKQNRVLVQAEKDINAELEKQLDNLEKTGTFEVDTLNAIIEKKVKAEKDFITQREQFAIESVYRRLDQQEKAEFDALVDEREKLIAQEGITQDAIDKINIEYDKKDDELVDNQIKRREDAALEIEGIQEKAINDRVKAEEEGLKKIEDNQKQFDDKQKEIDDDEVSKTQEKYDNINQIVQLATDYFIEQSNRKIAQIDKEIQAAQKQFDYLQNLAAQGNINAQQSLAEQQKIIDEANQRKLKQEQFQARIQLASSAYQTYNQKLAANKENPLAETITDITLLQSFINSLPTFYEGTEDTGTNGRGVDNKGGFHAILHPNERVIPKHLNDNLKGITNEDLTNMAVQYRINKSVGEYVGAEQISNGYEFYTLGSKLDKLTKVIEHKPETNIELGEITNSVMEIVKSTKRGNTIMYNKFKVKK